MFPLPASNWQGLRANFAKVLHNVHVPREPDRPPGSTEAAAAGPGVTSEDAGMPPPQPVALSVAGAARGLGVAPGTLRSWERRYGIAPSLHTPGGHRRYGPVDLARLGVMHRLVQEGVPPAEAAHVAVHTEFGPEPVDGAHPYSVVLGAMPGGTAQNRNEATAGAVHPVPSSAEGPASSGGGRVLPMPRSPRSARGLARAAMSLDSHSCHRTVSASLADRGAIPTWEELIRPVLSAVGERWAQTSRGVEIEHSFSTVVIGALAAHTGRLERPRNGRPVLLASATDELHDLPLMILQAALSDVGIRSHMLGARTPQDALRDAMGRLGPPVVFLWAQMPGAQVPDLPAQRPATTLVVGGPGWSGTPEGVEHVGDLEGAVGAVRTAMGL